MRKRERYRPREHLRLLRKTLRGYLSDLTELEIAKLLAFRQRHQTPAKNHEKIRSTANHPTRSL